MLNEILGKKDITNNTTKVLVKYLSRLQHTPSEKKTAEISRELVEEIIDLHGFEDFYDEVENSEPEPSPEPKPDQEEISKAKSTKFGQQDMQLFVEYLKEDQKFRQFLKTAIETAEKEEQEVRIFYKDKASQELYTKEQAENRLITYGSGITLEQLFRREVYTIDENGNPVERAQALLEKKILAKDAA